MIALIIAALMCAPSQIITVELEGSEMHVNSECAAVIENSGYTQASDVHKYVASTNEYLEACF